MAWWLERIGRFSFRRRALVVLLWVLVLGGVGAAAVKAPGPADEEFSMPGIESQRAFDLIGERFPGASAEGASATVVFVAPNGEKVTEGDNAATMDDVAAKISAGNQVARVVSASAGESISADKTIAFLTVSYEVDAADLSDASKTTLEGAVDQARADGLTVEVSGTALESGVSPVGKTELVGLAIAAIVLLLTFGSIVAAGLPLLTAIAGVAASLLSIWALGDAFQNAAAKCHQQRSVCRTPPRASRSSATRRTRAARRRSAGFRSPRWRPRGDLRDSLARGKATTAKGSARSSPA